MSEASSRLTHQSGESISRFLPFGVRAVLSVLDRLRLRALLKANGAHIYYAVLWNGLRTNTLPIDPRISSHSPPLDRTYDVSRALE